MSYITVDECWVAWAAGFIDGDGAIILTRNNRNWYQMRLEAYQKDRTPLDRLVLMFGGRVVEKVGSPYEMWIWRQVGQEMLPTLRKLVPWFTVKKARAELAIEFLEQYSNLSKMQQSEMFDHMRELQCRGGGQR